MSNINSKSTCPSSSATISLMENRSTSIKNLNENHQESSKLIKLLPISNRPCTFMQMIQKIVCKVFNDSKNIESISKNSDNNNKNNSNFFEFENWKCNQDKKIFENYKICPKTINLIKEMELNEETMLRKIFHNPIYRNSNQMLINMNNLNYKNQASTCCPPQANDLTNLERVRIDELETIFSPLLCRFSNHSQSHAKLKQYITYFMTTDCEQQFLDDKVLIDACEWTVNLFITLTKKIEPFSCLSFNDQIKLLQHNVLPILMFRSLIINNRSNNEKTKQTIFRFTENKEKRHLEDLLFDDQYMNQNDISKNKGTDEHKTKIRRTSSAILKKIYLDAVRNENENEMKSGDNQKNENDFLKEKHFFKKNDDDHNKAMEYQKQFKQNFCKLLNSLDDQWSNDNQICFLVFAIILFHPIDVKIKNGNSNQFCEDLDIVFEDLDKIKHEHYTYVYLLKRYLEDKYGSNCLARCHTIRILDLIHQVDRINNEIIQNLLAFNVSYSHNLLQKLCIC